MRVVDRMDYHPMVRSGRIAIICNEHSPRDLGPGPTTLAFERSEKRDLEHDDHSVVPAIGICVSGSRSEDRKSVV